MGLTLRIYGVDREEFAAAQAQEAHVRRHVHEPFCDEERYAQVEAARSNLVEKMNRKVSESYGLNVGGWVWDGRRTIWVKVLSDFKKNIREQAWHPDIKVPLI